MSRKRRHSRNLHHDLPSDTVQGKADHINNATSRSPQEAQQTFANSFEETFNSLGLGTCGVAAITLKFVAQNSLH